MLDIKTKAGSSKAAALAEKTPDKVVGNIYETENFGQFSFFEDNRKINKTHVNAIKTGIKEGKTQRLETLLVVLMNDGRRVVADGNHRLKAAVELSEKGFPVKLRYTLMTEKDILKQEKSVGEFVQRLNNDRNDWPLDDMIIFFSKNDDDPERKASYSKLVELNDSGKYFPKANRRWRYLACILSDGKCQAAALKKGLFRTEMSTAQFEHYYNKISKIADALGVELKNNFVETLIGSWFTVKNTVEYDEFIDSYGFSGFLDRLKGKEADVTITDANYWKDIFMEVLK